MNISRRLQELGIGADRYRFITSAENSAVRAMPPIKHACVTAGVLLHKCGMCTGRTEDEQMIVIAHQAITMDLDARRFDRACNTGQKGLAINIVQENIGVRGATIHHVVPGPIMIGAN